MKPNNNEDHNQLIAERDQLRKEIAELRAKEAEHQQLKEALHKRESEIQSLLAIAPHPVVARFDRQLRHTHVRAAVELATHIPPENYIGKTSREMGMPESAASLWESALLKVFDEGKAQTIEYSLAVAGRNWVFQSSISPEFDAENNVETVLAVTRDISQQRHAENDLLEHKDILETVRDLGQILSAELDLKKLVQTMTDAATEISRAEFGSFFYNILNKDGESYMLYTLSGVPHDAFAHFPMPRNTDIFAPTFHGEGTLRLDDVHGDPRYGKNSPYYGMPKGHLPVTSYLAVPVISRSGEVLGGLFFGHSKAGVFTQRAERIIEGLAAQVAVAMDNARLYQHAQNQQERLQTTLASIGDAVIATDSKGHISFMNPVAQALTGWTERDAIGLPLENIFRIINEFTRETAESPVTKVIQQGGIVGLANHTLLLSRDGREIAIDDSGAPIRSPEGELIGVILVFRDINDRKLSEKRINLLFELSTAFSEALTPKQIAEVLVEQARKALGAIFGTVWLTMGDGTMLEMLNRHGLPKATVDQYRQMPIETPGPLRDAMQNDAIVWMETLDDYIGRYPYYESAIRDNGSRSTICMPLKIDERIIGGFTLSFPFDKPYNDEEAAFFKTLANLCAQSLERARLYEEALDSRELLQTRVKLQSLISELGQEALVSYDLSALLNKSAVLLAQTLDVKFTKILELLPDEDSLLLRAGVGWKDGYVGHIKMSSDKSQGGYTLLSHHPVIVEDLPTETRFTSPSLLAEHQIRSGISVIIEGHEQPWGVLGIHSQEQRVFSADDIYFVQSVANILGAALERARLDAVLESERQRLATIIATVPGIIWENEHIDDAEEMKLVFISAYVETMLGYTVEEALAEPHFWFKIFHPEDAQKTAAAFYKVRQSHTSGVVNFRAVHKDGHVIDIQALMTTIMQDDKPVGKRGVMMDVSERQRLMQAQERYAMMLRRSNEELQQFAYVASHDLQEPLRMVISYMQLIESRYSPQLDDQAREFIGYAVDGAMRMRDLIIALLTYSRLDRMEKVFTDFDAYKAIEKVLANLALQIEDTGTIITHDPMPTIRADLVQITQLFQNLISNAIKFKRAEPPQIHIGIEQKAHEWQFSVRDNGIGIPAKSTERIFIIFQRLHRKNEYPGTGIGLAISKKVIERHEGRIWIESVVGEGSVVYFTIPK